MTNLQQTPETNSTLTRKNSPKLFLTDYASYNNGTQFEFGHWIDLTDFLDASELMQYISNHFAECDKKSPLPCGTPREETMFTDFENFPEWLYGESMDESDIEKIYKYIELDYNNLDENEIISLWNEYCSEERNGEDEILDNDEDFFNTYFENNPESAVKAALYGDYRYMDKYVQFNGYGNLDSFNDAMDVIDETELIKWLIDNK